MPRLLTRSDLRACLADASALPEGQFIKALVPAVEPVGDQSRSLRFTISTGSVDRDEDTIDPQGWELGPFKQNPVVLWAHDYSQLPVGKATAIGVEGSALKATVEFDVHPFAETVFRMLKQGFLRATSVGFKPKAFKAAKERDGYDFQRQELLEFSIVPVPANPEALIEARAAGIDVDLLKTWADGVTKAFAASPRGEVTVGAVQAALDLNASVPPMEVGEVIPPSPLRIETPRGPQVKVYDDARTNYFWRPEAEIPAEDPVRWNRSLSKAFDVEGEPLPASTLEYTWVSRYLETPVKDLFETTLHVPAPRMGQYLSALDDALGRFQLAALRNLDRDKEIPPVYETLQLNSKLSRSFLVEGIRFLRGDFKAVAKVQPSWSGVALTCYVARGGADALLDLLQEVGAKAATYKFLRGEAFALSGEFLTRGEETWDDLFLAPVNRDPLARTAKLVNEQGAAMDSRGAILMGPPGTGKTLAGRVLMNACPDATYIWLSSRDFYRAGIFGGLTLAYDLAAENAPSVVFIEDIDSWWDPAAVDLLKTELDGLKQRKGIVTILTTNFPEQLPEALIDRPGRFHDVLRLDLPTETIRREMLAKWAPSAAPEVLDQLAKETQGLSGAHLRELVRFAEVLRTQDAVDLGVALVSALGKVKEQRELIDSVQAGRTRVRRAIHRTLTRGFALGAQPSVAVTFKAEADSRRPCMKCGQMVPLSAAYCPSCGAQMAETAAAPLPVDPAGLHALVASFADGSLARTIAGLVREELRPQAPPVLQAEADAEPVLDLIEDEEAAIELADEDDEVVDVDPEEVRALLRESFQIRDARELVTASVEAALNRARGRVD